MIAVLAASTAASNAASASNGSNALGTDYPVAILTAALLGYFGFLIINRVTRGDSYVKLRNVMLASLLLHLLCAPLQILVVDHFYHGVADWLRYDHQGALLADNWRAGQFTLSGTGITRIVGDGSVSIYGGVIMTITGPNHLAAFFVAAFLAFVGTVFFYLAFRVTFPDADRARYAVLVFLFPSILFWTADVGKESVMLIALGLIAYGMALVLKGRPLGYPPALAGGALALVVRPDELIIIVVAFAMAMAIRGLFRQGRKIRPFRVIAVVIFVGALVVLTGTAASHFLGTASGGKGLTGTLNSVSSNNQGTGAGFGSSQVPYSTNPLYYPRDVYTVLFDPLPFQARSVTQLVAALENTLILVVILMSFRQLRCLFRIIFLRPYVLVALLYSLVFMYAFAALGNLGLITRERTLLLPLLFVLLAIPVAREGEDPYPWQLPRRLRRPVAESDTAFSVRPQEQESGWYAEDGTGMAQEWIADPVEETQAADWSPADWGAEP